MRPNVSSKHLNKTRVSPRRSRNMVALLSLALLIAACGSSSSATSKTSSSSTAASGSSKSPYVIHAILSTTGSAAAVGAPEEAALKGAEAYVNSTGGIDGHPLKFAIQNNQSSPSTAATVEPTVPAIMIGTLDATRFDANDAATVGLLWLF